MVSACETCTAASTFWFGASASMRPNIAMSAADSGAQATSAAVSLPGLAPSPQRSARSKARFFSSGEIITIWRVKSGFWSVSGLIRAMEPAISRAMSIARVGLDAPAGEALDDEAAEPLGALGQMALQLLGEDRRGAPGGA